MPGVISLAIPNRNDQHVRSQGWEQERDEGWFFPSMGVSGGNVGVGGAGVSGWGRVQAKECGRALDRSGGDGTGMEGLEGSLGWRDADREIPSSCRRSRIP